MQRVHESWELPFGLNVIPWGVEPQSKEPESFILSIKLWDRFPHLRLAKLLKYL